MRATRLGRCAVVLGLVLVAAGGCDRLPGRPRSEPAPGPDARFEALYARNCAGCHGADGRLGAARPLADPLYLAWIGDAPLRRVSAEGVPRSLMPGFARSAGGPLDDEELDLLVQGMRRRWGGGEGGIAPPAYAVPAGSPGDVAHGAEVFDRYCAGCHGTDGAGGEHAGSVVDRDYLALVSDQALRSAVVAGREDLGMPGFARRAPLEPLDERAVADVVAWLASHRGGGQP